jgi:hypothetical protein
MSKYVVPGILLGAVVGLVLEPLFPDLLYRDVILRMGLNKGLGYPPDFVLIPESFIMNWQYV